MYVASCIAAVISGYILSQIENVLIRKTFSTVMGILIQAYMYGIGKWSWFPHLMHETYRNIPKSGHFNSFLHLNDHLKQE